MSSVTWLLKLVTVFFILKYNRVFSNGNDKTKYSNNFMPEYSRMSVLSVIT